MAAVAPQGPIPGAQTPQQDPAGPSQLSWEGDKMFNIYIYDYCHKRGFRNTARELLREAEIAPDSTPPINARQGLLFEWWSVFWVLFTAKANGNGPDEAMLYTHHQAAQAAMKQNQNRAPAPQPIPIPGSGLMSGQPPIGRPGVNGVGPPRFPNGIPNGIPQNNGQPPGPTAFNAAPGMPPNGIMSGQPGMGQQFMGQPRPPLPGQPRPPNGGPPFQSPTMAHSPPNQQPQGQPQHGVPPPMGQLGPPRGMLPPGAQQMNPMQTPYQGLAGRPPSRTSTPQSAGMMNPSPSMQPRQPIVPGSDPRQQLDMAAISVEVQNMPINVLNSLKMEVGLPDKNINTMTQQDKVRIFQAHRARMQKTGPPGPQNAAAGPSMQAPLQQRRNNKRNSTSPGEDQTQPDDRNGSSPPDRKRPRRSPMEPPLHSTPMNNYGQHPNQPPQPQPGGPGGPGGPPQGMGNGGMMRPMSGPMGGGFQPQGQPGMQPGMQQMSGPMGMLGMSPMMPGGGVQNSMSPQMHAQPTMMQYRQHNLQHQQQQGHPGNRMSMSGPMNAGSPGSDPSFNPNGVIQAGVGGPGQQQQFGGPGNRLSGPQNPKAPMGMLPPPSPAKDQNKDNKGPNGLVDGSPRNQPLSNPNAPGTAPPTPNSSGQQQQQQQQGGQQQQQNQGQQQQNTPAAQTLMMNPNVNPGAMNNVALPLPPAPSATDNLFSSEFIQSVANGLDEFVDVGLFRGDGDLNFERDFGQWFNPDDVGMELGKQ
ncbi:hypothetical protein B0H12DRAFT_1228622 [Mycena haematopus]|nr:hypothetical protein B0H12DRAFT_1228622 [Mycena haematopus]